MLHLSLAAIHANPSSPASPNSNAASPASNPDPALLAGIAAYRRHPSHRTLPDPPVLWHDGAARLLDYGASADPAVLFVPSLVNRAYILDLQPDNSIVRFLAAAGLRPLVLDWGWPGPVERTFTLADYIAGPLERALAAIGQPAILVGYCMGGLLALAAALRRPDLVRGLALLATPWNFRAVDPDRATLLAHAIRMMEPMLAVGGTLPIDALQTLFALLDPHAVATKYRAFGRADQTSARARRFVAIEDWANDCVPLAAPVARECLGQWYGQNAPLHRQWRVAGMVVAPEALRRPAFVAIPADDRIVPPQSATPLAQALPGATIVTPASGHVGMIAGSRAQALLWDPLLAWLRSV